jgi:hypothetical protein
MQDEQRQSVTPPRSLRDPAGLPVFAWLLLLTCLLRFPAMVSHPFCIDESYYAAGAVELASGGTFFRDVVDHKSPGIYYVYAAIYRVAGPYNQTAVHAVLLVVAALTAYFLGLLAQEFFGPRVGRWAGTLYALASVIGPANDFQAANTELFMNLPVAAALWLSARLWLGKAGRYVEAPVMGLLVGVAILVRPQAAVALVPIGVALWRGRAGWRTAAVVACAAALPTLVLVASLWRADALADLRASLAYANYYAKCLPFEVKLANASLKSLFFVGINLGLMIPVTMLLARGRRRDPVWRQGAGCLLGSWLLASVVAVSSGGRFYPHYFIQALPPLVVMAARQLCSWRTESA